MINEIYLNFPNENSSTLKINYKITQENNIHTIACTVDPKYQVPSWLQSTKFNFNSLKRNDHFSLLFEDMKFNKNLETILFMDRCYAKIMKSSALSFDY